MRIQWYECYFLGDPSKITHTAANKDTRRGVIFVNSPERFRVRVRN